MFSILLFYFIFGAIIGSFLNVCIYRLPNGRSIVKPPSACGSCGHRLYPLDLIPIFSYFLLHGRCRYCGASYSCRYAVVEFLTGSLFVIIGYNFFLSTRVLFLFVLTACLIIETFVDLDEMIILDEILVLLFPLGLAYGYYYLPEGIISSLEGAGVAGVIMLAIFLLSRGGMGAGDVKLAFVIGAWLGFSGSLMFLLLAFIGGGLIGILLFFFSVKGRKDAIPFGPFLCLSAYITVIYYPYLLKFYWNLFI